MIHSLNSEKESGNKEEETFRAGTTRLTLAISTMTSRPALESLPLRNGDPKYSAWGLWGNDDTLGTLNLLTPELVQHAARQVVTGETIPLKYVLTLMKTDGLLTFCPACPWTAYVDR